MAILASKGALSARVLICGLFCLLVGLPAAHAQRAQPFRDGELLVRLKDRVPEARLRQLLEARGDRIQRRFRLRRRANHPVNRLFRIQLRRGETVEAAIQALENNPFIEAVQPNYVYQKAGLPPNDTLFDELWGLENTGQAGQRGPLPALPDADMDWLEAYDLLGNFTGSALIGIEKPPCLRRDHHDDSLALFSGR